MYANRIRILKPKFENSKYALRLTSLLQMHNVHTGYARNIWTGTATNDRAINDNVYFGKYFGETFMRGEGPT